MIKKQLKEIRYLYENLLNILERQNDIENKYIISQINISLNLINKYLLSKNIPNENIIIIKKLFKIYRNINKPRVGLSDYFIWEEDIEKRRKVNAELNMIKNRLREIFTNNHLYT